MKKIIIYGAGLNYIFSYYELAKYYDISAVVDSDKTKVGHRICNHTVVDFSDALQCKYDYIVITPVDNGGIREIIRQNGVEDEKVILLQQAFDYIGDNEWKSKKIISKNLVLSQPRIALIFFGGMGDILIGKIWVERLIYKYGVKPEQLDLYFSNSGMQAGSTIYRGIVQEDRIHSIEVLQDMASNYFMIARFCIVPEIIELSTTVATAVSGEFMDYISRLFSFAIDNYNRGLFTATDYYRTIKKEFVDKTGVLYHTAYDVLGCLDAKASDKTSIPISIDSKDFLSKVGLADKKYITLNTGLNEEYLNKKSTREWKFDNWNKLSKSIKKEFPDITTVQVGLKRNVKDDIDADVHLNGETSLEEIAVVLQNSILHVDYDGGLVHVNHMVGGHSLVLMGPSSAEKHAYPENTYIQASGCAPFEWETPDWLSRYPDPSKENCMDSISVLQVMNEIRNILRGNKLEG